jgi:electron transfer flavoprotein alpha subunit
MIFAVIEHDGSAVTEPTLQMLTMARGWAADTGSQLQALLVGSGPAGLAEALQGCGVARIIRIEHEALDTYAPAAWARAIAQVTTDRSPQGVVAPGTARGNEVMAHLAALSGLPLASNCTAVTPGNPFRVTRFRWGGSLLEEALIEPTPVMLTVALHAVIPESAGADPPVEERVDATLSEADLRVRAARHEKEVIEGVSLKTAPVVVGGGRGVGDAEGYAVLEELAGLLNGAVGCSRVATNNGWRSHSDQVGLTGTRISPVLYIACGISGAIQHQVGCKGSKNIMVINKDPEAAFFAKADYGIVGDLHEVVPAIIAELRK